MCAVTGDIASHRFLVATNSHKKENEVHLLHYSEDSNRIDQEAVFSLDNGDAEIWSMSASPYNKEVFACGLSYKGVDESTSHKVAVLDMSEVLEASKDFDKKKIRAKVELDGHTSTIHSIQWEDQEASEGFTAKELVTGDSNGVIVWDL